MAEQKPLTTGVRYDVDALRHIGWTEGDGTDTNGYNCWDYFDESGRYLGPDQHSIEPLFADRN